jgi:expansin (peptidoglycan-binding protein)
VPLAYLRVRGRRAYVSVYVRARFPGASLSPNSYAY